MKIAFVALAALSVLSTTAARVPDGVPTLRLDKTRFASRESIFFWVGVSAPDGGSVSHELGDTCRLTITRPDGTEKIERVGWPIDGPPDSGWLGGHTLGEASQIGTYTLVFEFAGQQTPPTSFTVEDVPILQSITAAFAFPSPLILGPSGGSVTLAVHNGSAQTIRFPRRGESYGPVWMSFRKTDGHYSSSLQYPQRSLLTAADLASPGISPDRSFTWDFLPKVRPITVGPGEDYMLQLPLAGALEQSGSLPSGQYEVTCSTTLELFVGAADGRWAEFCPLRISVDSRATGLVR
jgi:hypothetical protein